MTSEETTRDGRYATTVRRIDLNADLGESFGIYRYGNDDALMPIITSANIACGFHAGDAATMRASVARALELGLAVGAHIGLPDRLGFGRRNLAISAQDAYDYSVYQIGALEGFVRAAGGRLRHVKPHGALYMMASEQRNLAMGIVRAVADVDRSLAVYALPGSELAIAAAEDGLAVRPEFFVDRPYRGAEVVMFGWSYAELGSPADAVRRVDEMLGSPGFGAIETLCVHSDTDDAPAIAAAVRAALEARADVVLAH
ncbi:5-oxoprolinase subunit PxpA [Agromyces albus]|uniref:5-oxoprolinase subunit PxpA n=1 Tax=Agromyces albus TaxID=205332 RepID=A0A4Q2KXD7_9MICO|nr:5-oxoprolinase subunit PxpA [Agromyces albus]RXZ70304.1 5-oxoprolinase subunit PxpA [Agromyces albus]